MKIDIFSIFIGVVLTLFLFQLKTCSFTKQFFPDSINDVFTIGEDECESQYFNSTSTDTVFLTRKVYLQSKPQIVRKDILIHDTIQVIKYKDRYVNLGKKTFTTEQYHTDVGLEIIASDKITIENNELVGHEQRLILLDTIPINMTSTNEVNYYSSETPFSFAVGAQTSLDELQLKPSLDFRYREHGFQYNYDVFNKEHSIGYKYWINGRKTTKQVK